MIAEPPAKMPGADSYPNWLFPVSLVVATPFFAFFAYEGNFLRAFVGALSAGTVFAISVTLWDYRKFKSLWAVLLTAAAVHCVLVLSLPNADTHFPGVIFTPAVVIDILFWQFAAVRLINLFSRKF